MWRGCFIISWDKIWPQRLIDLNSPDMTVNPNPLSRAQWLFFFFFFLDKGRQTQPWLPCSAVTHGCLFCTSMAMDPQCGSRLNPAETCLCPCPEHRAQIPSCKSALGQKHSRSPRSIIPSGRDMLEKKRGFLVLGTPHTLCRSDMGMAASLFINTAGISSDESQHEQVFV